MPLAGAGISTTRAAIVASCTGTALTTRVPAEGIGTLGLVLAGAGVRAAVWLQNGVNNQISASVISFVKLFCIWANTRIRPNPYKL